MNKNQVKGPVEQVEGQAKKTTGKVAGNNNLAENSKRQKEIGKVRSDFGDLKAGLIDKF